MHYKYFAPFTFTMNSKGTSQQKIHMDVDKLLEFIHSGNREMQSYALSALENIVMTFGDLPPAIQIGGLIDIALDMESAVYKKGDIVTPKLIQEKIRKILQWHIYKTDNVEPLLEYMKKRMKEDVEIHEGGFLLEICNYSAKVGKVSLDLFAILNISLGSASVQEHNKVAALETIEVLLGAGEDIRRVKRMLRKVADGKSGYLNTKAQGIYIQAASQKFNKPPNWFVRKRNAFKTWRMDNRATLIPKPVEKLRRGL